MNQVDRVFAILAGLALTAGIIGAVWVWDWRWLVTGLALMMLCAVLGATFGAAGKR